jgi:HlyD family secretion protein
VSRDSSIAVIRQFQSETDAIREAPEPFAARSAVLALAGLIVAAIAISAVMRVDRVIDSAGGTIVSTEEPEVFQALDPSIIKSVNVKEGETVAAGDVLATLDPTFAAADVDQLKQQIAGLKAEIDRATAEQRQKPLTFDTESDPDMVPYTKLQRSLYEQRAAALDAQLKSFDEKIKQAQATVTKYKQDESRYVDHDKIAQQIEDMRAKLNQSGSGSLLNLLIANDSRVEVLRNLEFDHNSLIEADHTLSSVMADRETTLQQWNAATSQEIVTAQTSLDQAEAQLTKAVKHQDLVRLVAPEPAMVLTIAKLSVGSVLKEGDALLTLAPLRTPVEAEIKIASRDVGFVRQGDPVTLKIDAFNFSEHGFAEGRVRWISEGAFTTDDNGQAVSAYYKARVAIERMKFVDVPKNFRLIPGMTLAADIKVGTRSVFRYVVGGFVRGAGEAMREP